MPTLIEELSRLGRGDIMVVVGGVIPPRDHEYLHQRGVAAVFGPGTVIPAAALELMGQLEQRLEQP